MIPWCMGRRLCNPPKYIHDLLSFSISGEFLWISMIFCFNVVAYFASGLNWIVVVNIRIVVQLIGLNGDCVAGWPRKFGPATQTILVIIQWLSFCLKKGFSILHIWYTGLAWTFARKTVSISCYFQDYGLRFSNDWNHIFYSDFLLCYSILIIHYGPFVHNWYMRWVLSV